MGFYKSVFLGFSLLLIITLIVITYILSNRNKSQLFPPTLSSCPDFYSLSNEGKCVMESAVYSNSSDTCKLLNSSGMTKKDKKLWAVDCGVSWDGITNNSII